MQRSEAWLHWARPNLSFLSPLPALRSPPLLLFPSLLSCALFCCQLRDFSGQYWLSCPICSIFLHYFGANGASLQGFSFLAPQFRAKCALITQPYYNANRYSPPRKLCRNSLFMPLRALSVADWTTINIKFACTKIQQRATNAAEVSAGQDSAVSTHGVKVRQDELLPQGLWSLRQANQAPKSALQRPPPNP